MSKILEQTFEKLEQDIQTVIEGTKHDSRERAIALVFQWMAPEDRKALVERMQRAIAERAVR